MDFISHMNRHFDQNFGNPHNNFVNNYTSNKVSNTNINNNISCTNTIYYNSSQKTPSRLVFYEYTSDHYKQNEDKGYTVIYCNNISRNFCANNCK